MISEPEVDRIRIEGIQVKRSYDQTLLVGDVVTQPL